MIGRRRTRRGLTYRGIARAYNVPVRLIRPPFRSRCRAYVHRHEREGAVARRLRDLPPRVLIATAIGYPNGIRTHLTRAFALWTCQPGDRFVWFVCDLTLEVIDARRPGRPVLRAVADANGLPLRRYGWHPEVYRVVDRPGSTWGTIPTYDLIPERHMRRARAE